MVSLYNTLIVTLECNMNVLARLCVHFFYPKSIISPQKQDFVFFSRFWGSSSSRTSRASRFVAMDFSNTMCGLAPTLITDYLSTCVIPNRYRKDRSATLFSGDRPPEVDFKKSWFLWPRWMKNQKNKFKILFLHPLECFKSKRYIRNKIFLFFRPQCKWNVKKNIEKNVFFSEMTFLCEKVPPDENFRFSTKVFKIILEHLETLFDAFIRMPRVFNIPVWEIQKNQAYMHRRCPVKSISKNVIVRVKKWWKSHIIFKKTIIHSVRVIKTEKIHAKKNLRFSHRSMQTSCLKKHRKKRVFFWNDIFVWKSSPRWKFSIFQKSSQNHSRTPRDRLWCIYTPATCF